MAGPELTGLVNALYQMSGSRERRDTEVHRKRRNISIYLIINNEIHQ